MNTQMSSIHYAYGVDSKSLEVLDFVFQNISLSTRLGQRLLCVLRYPLWIWLLSQPSCYNQVVIFS